MKENNLEISTYTGPFTMEALSSKDVVIKLEISEEEKVLPGETPTIYMDEIDVFIDGQIVEDKPAGEVGKLMRQGLKVRYEVTTKDIKDRPLLCDDFDKLTYEQIKEWKASKGVI